MFFVFVFFPNWGGGGPYLEKKLNFICLFHVSEHVDHFKATFFYFFLLEIDPSENPPSIWKIPNIFYFFIFDPFPYSLFFLYQGRWVLMTVQNDEMNYQFQLITYSLLQYLTERKHNHE